MINLEEFQAAVTSLLQLLPMQRPLTAPALVLAWDTFPAAAKRDLTGDVLRFCVAQRLADPAPPRELAPHLALLRYAYPLEHDRPVVERGLRADLRERMAQPDRFHDPAPRRDEQVQAAERAPRLPGNAQSWHPGQLRPEQRRAHVERVAATARRWIADGVDQRQWTSAQLEQGLWWFQRALQGFWLLEVDGGGIAKAWLTRNPDWAERLIGEAMVSNAPQLPPAEGLAVSFAVIGTSGRRTA